ncbi:MAG: hypothetical protein GF392_04750, partial [Candidatus Omnitrophica bacterium]|nr:hypothetical protein [Candidatus Omnitrophota bacterium]
RIIAERKAEAERKRREEQKRKAEEERMEVAAARRERSTGVMSRQKARELESIENLKVQLRKYADEGNVEGIEALAVQLAGRIKRDDNFRKAFVLARNRAQERVRESEEEMRRRFREQQEELDGSGVMADAEVQRKSGKEAEEAGALAEEDDTGGVIGHRGGLYPDIDNMIRKLFRSLANTDNAEVKDFLEKNGIIGEDGMFDLERLYTALSKDPGMREMLRRSNLGLELLRDSGGSIIVISSVIKESHCGRGSGQVWISREDMEETARENGITAADALRAIVAHEKAEREYMVEIARRHAGEDWYGWLKARDRLAKSGDEEVRENNRKWLAAAHESAVEAEERFIAGVRARRREIEVLQKRIMLEVAGAEGLEMGELAGRISDIEELITEAQERGMDEELIMNHRKDLADMRSRLAGLVRQRAREIGELSGEEREESVEDMRSEMQLLAQALSKADLAAAQEMLDEIEQQEEKAEPGEDRERETTDIEKPVVSEGGELSKEAEEYLSDKNNYSEEQYETVEGEEDLEDGFVYPGTNGWGAREVLVFDSRVDPVFREFLEGGMKILRDRERELGRPLKTMEKLDLLMEYVKSRIEGDISFASDLQKNKKGEVVFIGEIISEGKGVCRHRASLMKFLMQEAGIKCRLVRGDVYGPVKEAHGDDAREEGEKRGRHIWIEMDASIDGK